MSISSLRFFGRHDYPRKFCSKKLNQKALYKHLLDKVSELEYEERKNMFYQDRICF